jgi:hypothetical protein
LIVVHNLKDLKNVVIVIKNPFGHHISVRFHAALLSSVYPAVSFTLKVSDIDETTIELACRRVSLSHVLPPV